MGEGLSVESKAPHQRSDVEGIGVGTDKEEGSTVEDVSELGRQTIEATVLLTSSLQVDSCWSQEIWARVWESRE